MRHLIVMPLLSILYKRVATLFSCSSTCQRSAVSSLGFALSTWRVGCFAIRLFASKEKTLLAKRTFFFSGGINLPIEMRQGLLAVTPLGAPPRSHERSELARVIKNHA